MFHRRSREFDPRLSGIVDQLRAIEKEIGGASQRAGRQASQRASVAGDQIAEAIGPILNDLLERFGRGRRAAADRVSSLSDDALRAGSQFGNDAVRQITAQARERPLITLAVAIGVGVLIGMAARRS